MCCGELSSAGGAPGRVDGSLLGEGGVPFEAAKHSHQTS